MIWRLFKREAPRGLAVETLHRRINDASRQPGLYTGLGVPDTVEGRFECLCLHVILVLRRLETLPEPAADVAQDLVNAVFLQLDSSLRELGVGDFGVPKRMKKLGAAFYGRAETYGAALATKDGEALATALARNVIGTPEPGDGAGLARYVLAAAAALEGTDLDALLASGPGFPSPDAFTDQTGAP
ncbi:ubiquinol-cytochrome C chaperone family protein [Methylobacterium sp. Leaf108]|uniref:ubiquinol-cytochrome C chaperone family protein n=1 Tax=Methylobacterium sp. Leaf108 TaxID=1736256 RepID=UPI0006F41679|nr:ubiquinol-cytochrome C chaperone family protein [Methylobacterium sp. Leaf108]KQP51976.1 ubiquinol-cytochrome C chaperone [Methylobacterium sp. Leaf108]